MSDAPAPAAAAVAEASVAAEGGGESVENAAPAGKETPAQAAARKLKLKIDDKEVELDESEIVGNYKRGKNAAQLAAAAEKKAREAAQREERLAREKAELDARLSRLKDPKEARKLLKEMGLDVRSMSVEEIQEAIEEERKAAELTPEQKRIKELEEREAKRLAEEEKAKKEEADKAYAADVEKHTEELSSLFLSVLEQAGLPKGSARRAFPYVASLYQAAEAAGEQVDPALAAEHIRARFSEEHDWLWRNQDGKLNLEALKARLKPEDLDALRREAVKEYMAKRKAPGMPVAQQNDMTPSAGGSNNGTPSAKGAFGSKYWKELEMRIK